MSKLQTGIACIIILLLQAATVCAQNNTVPQTTEQRIPLVFEKAYLHTDRDVYTQGDTLWFKAYLVNAQDNKPINSSGTLYVELLAPDSTKILTREIIRLDNGLGNGDMELTDTLASGSYRLRAYTNWMRNFGDSFVFEKNITILNTQAVPVAPDPKAASAKNKDKNKDKKAATAATTPATATLSATPTVRFYPEGGSLVQGIASVLGVKAEDAFGKGMALSGVVLSSDNDTVSRFSCDSLGMGMCTLIPVKGQAYHAVIHVQGGALKQTDPGLIFALPSVLTGGPALQIKQADTAMYAIVSSNNPGPVNYLLSVKHAGKTLIGQQVQANSSPFTVKILTSSLPEGVSAITLYNEQGKPQCERLAYIHHTGSVPAAAISINKKTYNANERATIQINAPANSALSMAVVDAGVVPEQADDIVAYFMLQSEIKGNIAHAHRYFDTTNVNRLKQLDLLLLTQGWRDFVWRRLADTAIRISYAAEEGISVSGKVRDENLNKWLPGLNITLFANGAKGNKMFTAMSNSSGRFNFHNLMLYGYQPIKLSAANNKGKIGGALWVDTLQPISVQLRIIKTAGQETTKDSSISVAMKKIAANDPRLSKATALKEVTIKDSKYKRMVLKDGTIYSPWGSSLNQSFPITPKDYELKTLQWFTMYHIYGAHPRLDASGILIPIDGALVPPVLVINGSVKERYDMIDYYSLPIERFKRIQLKNVIIMGGKNGLKMKLVNLLLLDLREDYQIDNPGVLNATVQGYYEPRVFYKPLNEKDAAQYAYRSTIYWEPNIKTDATGKATISYYNAVLQTNVRVIVEGISPTGVPLLSQVQYRITE